MKRGDIVPVALSGDYGKPRPAVVIQTDRIDSDSTIVCLLTSQVRTGISVRRITVAPSVENGLLKPSQIMIEKLNVVLRSKCGAVMGRLDVETIDRLDDALAFIFGLLDQQ